MTKIKQLLIIKVLYLKKIIGNILKVVIPFLFGGGILYYTYRNFDFTKAWFALSEGMNYWWMILTLIFGILSHVIRGMRWKLTLAPLGENPKMKNCVNAVFVSYAANIVIPRIGEISRCGILKKYDGISFSKSLGTVVTERLVDTLCVGIITGVTLLMQTNIFGLFFDKTGTNLSVFAARFTSAETYIFLASFLGILVLVGLLLRKLSVFSKVAGVMKNIWIGIISLKKVKRKWLFVFSTIGIWTCYFLQFYLAFFCFNFSLHIGILAGLVLFVVGSIAVVVPTPNGAGPWHFAVITMMTLYGVSRENAGIFALLVHGIQTLLIIILGIYGLAVLPFTNKNKSV